MLPLLAQVTLNARPGDLPVLVSLVPAEVRRLDAYNLGGRWEIYQQASGRNPVTVGVAVWKGVQIVAPVQVPRAILGDVRCVARYIPPAMGDMNRDGRLSAGDGIILLNVALGKPFSVGDILLGDFNGDGRISVIDVQRLVNRLVGKE